MDRVAPRGARRFYHSDVEWQDAVERLTGASSCILASSVNSESTTWELDHIRTSGQRKLFILTAPKQPDYDTIWDLANTRWRPIIARLLHVTVCCIGPNIAL
jgi:hypothetical protein